MSLLAKISSKISQQGQAATEFLIASVFLLIPLFLIIPLLGKYIDIKQAAIQQARFEVWEYTVWDGPGEETMDGINGNESAGIKDYLSPSSRKEVLDTRHQGLHYFFSDPTAASYGNLAAQIQLNPLWVDHRGESLFPNSSEPIAGSIQEKSTPDGLRGILSTILDIMGKVLGYIGDIMSFVGGDGKFDALDTKGYFTSEVAVTVRSIDQILSPPSLSAPPNTMADPLVITARAAVLTEGWNAGSSDNAITESRGLVVSSFLRPISKTLNTFVNGINGVFDAFKRVPLVENSPLHLPGVPDFGYVEDDLIPLDHLKHTSANKAVELQEQNGLYYYQESSQ